MLTAVLNLLVKGQLNFSLTHYLRLLAQCVNTRLSSPQSADLEVKVGNAFGVEVLNTVQDLLEKLGGLFLSQRLLLSQKVKQLPAGHQLQNQDHVGLVFEDVMQSDDVAVLDLTQYIDLAFDLFTAHAPPAGRQTPFLDELCCILTACALLPTLPDNSKLSTAGRTTKKVVVGCVISK